MVSVQLSSFVMTFETQPEEGFEEETESPVAKNSKYTDRNMTNWIIFLSAICTQARNVNNHFDYLDKLSKYINDLLSVSDPHEHDS